MIWFIYLPISLIFEIIALLLAPILPIFSRMEIGRVNNNNDERIEPRLIRQLSWFMTPDNSLWGDNGWRTEHCRWQWGTYLGMVWWLWRNPAYGFSWTVLAATITPGDPARICGDVTINDHAHTFKSGWCFIRIGKYWHLCAVIPIGKWRYLDLNLGWKLKGFAANPEGIKEGTKVLLCHSPRLGSFPKGG